MYLKSLTLKGFKSFADRTSLAFDPGLTVVVGPNGSGKSNVSDSILWVLGEQSAKMLRGQAMEDVIFSGSSARQPVGLAEVTLVLDNADHTLPVDFSEVAITRRMYRSGESEYLINGAPSRLMDIQDILHDSGLGKDTHSIISQGKLDSILQSRPEERRALVEEAAGISKHRRRKERSERKISSMDEKLVRAKDISREIARQLRPLERQVDKAKRYNDLTSRLSEVETTLAVDDLRGLQRSWKELEAKGKEAEAAEEIARYQLGEKRDELERLQSMLEQKGLFVGDLGEQRRRMQDLLGRMDSDMRLLEEKGHNMVDRLSDMRMTLSSVEKQAHDARVELSSVAGELSDARVGADRLSNELEALEPAARAAADRRSELDRQMAQLTADMRAKQRAADAATLAHAKLADEISNAEVEDSMFESRLAQIEDSLATYGEALEARRSAAATAADALDAARAAVDEAEQAIEGRKRLLSESQAARESAREELSKARASLAALRTVDEAAESSSPLVAALAVDERAAGVVRARLGDLVGAPQELEGLVEELLGEALSALVVDGSGDAASLARTALSLSKPGQATVLSKDAPVASHPNEARGYSLVERLDVADGDRVLVEALLGGVRVVGDVDEAVAGHAERPELTYVTLDGVCAYSDGRLVVGTIQSAESGALERKRKIRSLEGGVPALEQAFSDAEASAQAAQADLTAANDALAAARGQVAQLVGEVDSARGEIGRLEGQISQATSEREQVSKRRAAAGRKVTDARPALERHKAEADAATAEAEGLTQRIQELADGREAVVQAERDASQALSEARLSLATVTERRRHLEVRHEELERRIRSLESRREETGRSAQALDVLRLRIDPLHERYEAIHQLAMGKAKMLRDRAQIAEADSAGLKKTIGDAKAQVTSASDELDRITSEANEAKVASGRLEVQVEEAIKAITTAGVYTLEEALHLPEPDDRGALEREAEKLRRQIEGIGPVNQVAMDEFLRLKERADYIDEQVADLERARVSLQKITAAIERKMRRQFSVTFERVNDNFKDIFGLLFPGGTAHLELTDPDHLDETGIEIVAQPRGKHIMKMSLMSGGERSLTALALLFAVYRTRTVPFYVFDEVEAALDDSNLDKLLGAIESLKETTQLIVISHQRRTMEQADVLYGVSMQADGVSHVVSQRLDHATGKVVDL